MFDSAYTNIRANVKWQGALSDDMDEGQGIRQGGLTSADAFNGKSNSMLTKASSSSDGFMIGPNNVSWWLMT